MNSRLPHLPPSAPTSLAATTASTLSACPGCDLLLPHCSPPRGFDLRCPRCGKKLAAAPQRDPLSRSLALSLTALLLFIPAHFLPLLTFDLLGMHHSGSIFDSVVVVLRQGYYPVALVVALTALIFPLAKPALLLAFCLGLRLELSASFLARLLRWHHHVEEWAMTEIYLIAILITIIKMHHNASVTYHYGFFCCIALGLITLATSVAVDEGRLWQLIGERLPGGDSVASATSSAGMARTAGAAGYAQCRICHKLVQMARAEPDHGHYCPRCGALLHIRTPDSEGRSWALILCAVILAFPANLLPIMEVDQFGMPQRSTILDGISFFFRSGSYGIGAIIFIASILVPVFKIVGMVVILLSVRFRWRSWLRHKVLMFRFIAFIGRWSMLDIFVIALLAALADFGFFSSIAVAEAAPFFSGVVIASMLAALSFDSRLLWDLSPEAGEGHNFHAPTGTAQET